MCDFMLVLMLVPGHPIKCNVIDLWVLEPQTFDHVMFHYANSCGKWFKHTCKLILQHLGFAHEIIF